MKLVLYISTSIILLILGLLIYYFLRPEIVIIQFLNDHFHLPIHRGHFGWSKSMVNFATGHLTDILWYASILFLLLAALEKNAFKPFYIYFITIPFILEILQGIRLIPGTFDWMDIFYYGLTLFIFLLFSPSLKLFFMKKNSLKYLIPSGILLAFIVFAIGSSPSSHVSYTTGTLSFAPRPDDNYTNPSLLKYLQSTPNPTIVLRVPNQVGGVVEANNTSQIYNTIEKELAESNFIVRDRALFQKVLDQNTSNDYSKIYQLTGTDLILELVSFNEKVPYNTNKYLDRKGRERISNINLMVPGIKVEFKLIQVQNNEIVGDYTFNYAPCTSGCRYTFDDSGNLYNPSNLNKKITTPYDFITPDQVENFFKRCTQHLIRQLRPSSI
ncbi:MAG: hypothetical protein ACYCOO_09995 [Chitinophagaceae bacterium]